MATIAVATPRPKRRVKVMSKAQLKNQLEGTGVTISKRISKTKLKKSVDEVVNTTAKVSDNPERGEY
jgi:hypothetical protein